MSNIIKFPVIADVEITTDDEGRFNLNALHRASGLGSNKAPAQWLRTQGAKDLVAELEQSDVHNCISASKGGSGAQGTFAHELLAISYAGWISPAFQLKVNQVFLDYRTGKLQQPKALSTLELIDMMRDTELKRIEAEESKKLLAAELDAAQPKIAFHDQVAKSEDTITIAEAAKILNTGRGRLFNFLREQGWITRKNEPYQAKIEQGYLGVKLSTYEHPYNGLQKAVTPVITGKGLARLQKIYSARNLAA